MPQRATKLAITLSVLIDAAAARGEALLENDLNNLLASGVSTELIRQYLEENAEGYKRAVVNEIMRGLRPAINQATVTPYWKRIRGASRYFRWIWEPTADHCPTCTHRNGMAGTREQFEAIGIPGAGTTKCKGGCRCTLVPITKEEYEQADRKVAA